jgi:plasmid maintenance system antidote protein VapI
LREQNISAYALAKKIGRRPHVITRLILGQRNASDKLKVEISQGLGLPVSEVFFFDNEK